jgi:hypothetical protein
LKFLIEFAGADNVMLGTDWPFATGIDKPLGMLDATAGGAAAAKTISETGPAAYFKLAA